MSSFDNPLTRNFVSPIYCRELQAEGFAEKSPFYWKGYSNTVMLVSFLFDKQGYYQEESRLADEINPPAYMLPAYTIMDVQRFIPSYLVTSDGMDNFEITLDKLYTGESCKAKRLPDAYAQMLLLGLRKKFIVLTTLKSEGK